MATNMQNKLEYSNLLYCNTIAYNQKMLCVAREVEVKSHQIEKLTHTNTVKFFQFLII